MDQADRIQLWISSIIRLSLLIAIGAAIFFGQWLNVFLITIIFCLTFFPAIIERNSQVFLPIEFELIMIFFTYAAFYLGEIHSFYTKFWWWDVFLHGFSSLFLGFIGFLIMYILNYELKVKLQMSPKLIALFSFTFALSIGAVWEIVEFSIDSIFGLNMQKSGLNDTMLDLIIDAAGGLISAFFGYLYLRRKKKPDSFVFNRFLRKFISENPKLFPSRRKKG